MRCAGWLAAEGLGSQRPWRRCRRFLLMFSRLPAPCAVLIASAANLNCPRRFLGAPAGCGPTELRLFDRRDKRAQVVWRMVPQ